MTEIRFVKDVRTALAGAEVVVAAAAKKALDGGWHRKALDAKWAAALDRAVEDTKPGDLGAVGQTYGGDGAPRRLVAAVLPDKVSRHDSASRSEMIRPCLEQAKLNGKKACVVIGVDDPSHYAAAAVAVARAFPLFSMQSKRPAKDGKKPAKGVVSVVVADRSGRAIAPPPGVQDLADTVRFVARLVDTPPDLMRTAHFEQEARKAVRGMRGVTVRSIVGDALLRKGLGGIHGVGRCATVPPRLVILEYKPRGRARRTVALVGKGIIYDTGGLDLKVGGNMVSMKCDMAGAAAVLGAFVTLASSGCPDRVVALCCMAENAIGPASYRSDDVLTLHSGKTVEINNTDAEGRLLLADGVSWAAREEKADFIVDIATLTGAARICTGDAVSCTVSNREGIERLSVECGRATGDLTFPLLFVPEFFRGEFPSKVADMQNSVKNRMNAQSSAAAQFVYNHIDDLDRPWLHLDVAGPAFRNGRGTGHGVALMTEIVRRLTDAHMRA